MNGHGARSCQSHKQIPASWSGKERKGCQPRASDKEYRKHGLTSHQKYVEERMGKRPAIYEQDGVLVLCAGVVQAAAVQQSPY